METEWVSVAFIQRFCNLWATEKKAQYTLADANLIAGNIRINGKRLLITFWEHKELEGFWNPKYTYKYYVTAESEADLERLQFAAE